MDLLSVAALLFVAGEVDVNAIVVTETRAGEAPLLAGQPPTPGFVGILTPRLDLHLRRSDAEVRLDYGPRLFWREPNRSERDGSSSIGPLILHVANLLVKGHAAPTVTLNGGASGSVGEADYTTLSQALGPSGGSATSPAATGSSVGSPVGPAQAALPARLGILSASAGAGAEVEASRIWRLGARLEVGHRRPRGDTGVPQQPVGAAVNSYPYFLLRQTSVLAEPAATLHFTRRDDFTLTTPLSEAWYSDGSHLFTVTPRIAWQTLLSPTAVLRLGGGVAYGSYSGPALGSGSSLRPVGSAEISGVLMRSRDVTMEGGIGAAVDYFVDPVLGAAGLRGSTSARWALGFGPDWTAGIEGSFSTSLREKPIVLSGVYSDETVAAVSLPVRCRTSDNLTIEFGGRWSDRGPHLRAPNSSFHQRQLWAYVMLTFTTRSSPRLVAPIR